MDKSLQDKLSASLTDGNSQGIKECVEELESQNFSLKGVLSLGRLLEYGAPSLRNLQSMEFLISHGANINETVNGETLLTCLFMDDRITDRDYKAAELLIQKGIDANVANEDGKTALELWLKNCNMFEPNPQIWDFYKLLLENTDMNEETFETCIFGCRNYTVAGEMIRYMETENALIPCSDALKYAITGESDKLISVLNDCDISKEEKRYIVLYACANCNIDAVKKLSEEEFDFQVEDDFGCTPLLAASAYNS